MLVWYPKYRRNSIRTEEGRSIGKKEGIEREREKNEEARRYEVYLVER